MPRAHTNTPQWFREEAEHCFRLAEKITDQRASDALISYGRELLAKAEGMAATLRGATNEDVISETLMDEAG